MKSFVFGVFHKLLNEGCIIKYPVGYHVLYYKVSGRVPCTVLEKTENTSDNLAV